MATVQMNTRIEEDVKAAGDAVFGRIGYTPSRVVRAVWGYAARNEANPEYVESMLSKAEGRDSPEGEERSRRVALAQRGPCIFEGFMGEMGVKDLPHFDETGLSPASVRERAAVQRAIEKGWIDG